MMVEQILLTTSLLGWPFDRLALQDEERQQLLDLGSERGLELGNDRAIWAVSGGATRRLREPLFADPTRPGPAPGRKRSQHEATAERR